LFENYNDKLHTFLLLLIKQVSTLDVNWPQDNYLKNHSLIWNIYGKSEAFEYFCLLSVYRGVNFIGGGDQSTRRKTTDLPQVTDKLYHIMLYGVHLAGARFELTKLVVIGTDCIGSCKSNYHMITTTTALNKIIDDCKSHRSFNTMDNIRYQSCKVGYGVLENSIHLLTGYECNITVIVPKVPTIFPGNAE
jgi:hypothetical protein